MPVSQWMLHKLNELSYTKKLPHLPCSSDLLPTNYHFFQAPEKLPAGKNFQ
jgi:hypothetical protein